jgi:dUTP pyrophosphatase
MTDFDFLQENLSKADLWQQLSEEASELAQAASKMERFYRGTNPPRKSRGELVSDVVEEHADIALCFRLLNWEDEDERKFVEEHKTMRWANAIRTAHAGKKKRGFALCEGVGELQPKVMQNVKIPQRATKLSAGYDCYLPIDIRLEPGESVKVDTGLKAWMQPGEVLLAVPRSGLGFKYFCRLANTIGVIDADYYNNPENEGQIAIKIRNEGDKVMELKAGTAFAQFLFMPYLLADGDDFDNGAARVGGFGSTDKTR